MDEQYYSPTIAVKAVVELTNALRIKNDAYARALLADPRMTSNRGMLASCGVNMREVKQIKAHLDVGMPTLEEQRRAIEFLNSIDKEHMPRG